MQGPQNPLPHSRRLSEMQQAQDKHLHGYEPPDFLPSPLPWAGPHCFLLRQTA